MRIGPMRVGVPEYVLFIGLAMVAGLVTWGVSSGWTIAIVPGVTYLLAATAAYAIYQTESQRSARGAQAASVPADRGQRLNPSFSTGPLTQGATAASFRVVAAQGVCPLGRQVGETVSIGSGGEITPELCRPAEAVLRLASAADPQPGVKEWCCPVYDHLLVFRRERLAA
jgi:hypothetical protein